MQAYEIKELISPTPYKRSHLGSQSALNKPSQEPVCISPEKARSSGPRILHVVEFQVSYLCQIFTFRLVCKFSVSSYSRAQQNILQVRSCLLASVSLIWAVPSSQAACNPSSNSCLLGSGSPGASATTRSILNSSVFNGASALSHLFVDPQSNLPFDDV